MHSVTLAQVFHKPDLFPTPVATDWKNGRPGDGYGPNLPLVATQLFPTPVASEGTKAPSQQTSEVKGKTGQVWLSNVAKDLEQTNDKTDTNWGKFEPAIRRWESILGRPAPEPTKPDGKDNNHRLSSKFTEWMMGLPDGWITGHDLKRNDELKLAGNGVVPQQAELALRLLLELPERKENNNE
jgi:DNA (cytosine-5)-methyltransferase 1